MKGIPALAMAAAVALASAAATSATGSNAAAYRAQVKRWLPGVL